MKNNQLFQKVKKVLSKDIEFYMNRTQDTRTLLKTINEIDCSYYGNNNDINRKENELLASILTQEQLRKSIEVYYKELQNNFSLLSAFIQETIETNNKEKKQ